MTRTLKFLTIHPELVEPYLSGGLFGRAAKKDLLATEVINLRAFAVDEHGSVDDRPYGGGEGMVLRPEPLAAATEAHAKDARIIVMSPTGSVFNHQKATELARDQRDLAFVCGRFAGIDQRFIDLYADDCISVGDFVLAGGELPALTVAESCLRLLPGALGHELSAQHESFTETFRGGLEHPLYTRPPVFKDSEVPAALLSGDHDRIAAWREKAARETTEKSRPDLLR